MDIKEYIKINYESNLQGVMKEIFSSLYDKFFPREYHYNTDVEDTYVSKTSSFQNRKVRVHLPNNKYSIGLMDEEGCNIKIINNQILKFALLTNDKIYYYNKELHSIFYREDKSRIVKLITKDIYEDNKANICLIKDYVLIDDNKFEPRFE